MSKSNKEGKKEFDLQTHGWDPQTRQLAWKNPYRMHHIKGVQYWERPVGSGNLYTKQDEPCGRIVDFKQLKIDKDAPHIEWEAPKSPAELAAAKQHELMSRNAELQAELDAIKKERKYEEMERKAKAEKAEAAAAVSPKKKAAPKIAKGEAKQG